MLIEQLREQAAFVRQCLESLPKEKLARHNLTSIYQAYETFPAGCCGDLSAILALHLKDKFNFKSQLIQGRLLDFDLNMIHAWIQCEGYYIDITADQFNDRLSASEKLPKVIISKKEDSAFHGRFKLIESSHEIKEYGHEDLHEILRIATAYNRATF